MSDLSEMIPRGMPVETVTRVTVDEPLLEPAAVLRRTTPAYGGVALAPDVPRELLCTACDREYPVWFAPNQLWNAVVRRPDGSDEYPFLCPTCFANLAVARGVGDYFVLSLAPERREDP